MSAQLLENIQYFGSDGLPLVGGKIYIGTLGQEPIGNLITIYSDEAQTIVLPNPQTIGTDGFSANKIYIPGRYSLRVNTVLAVQFKLDLNLGFAVETGTTTLGNVSGSSAITATAAVTITSYVDKELYTLKIATTNTATGVTLNIDGLGAKAIVKNFNQAIAPGDFTQNQIIRVAYNSTGDNFQWVDSGVKTKRSTKGTDIASASSITVPANDGNFFDITGSTGPVTAINGVAGTEYTFQTDSTPTFTNSASLLIEGGANYTAAAGDVFKIYMLTSSTCLLFAISKIDGKPLVMFTAATQAEQETGTSILAPVTPGRQQFHPSAAKAWIDFDGSGTVSILASYNVATLTDTGTGDYLITFDTDFSGANYAACITGIEVAGGVAFVGTGTTQTAGTNNIVSSDEAGTNADRDRLYGAWFGDQ